jgi:anthranilate phosphoribosyltransferase
LSAACGCIVAKAGNRSVSSACGSADVLEVLGVKVNLPPAQVIECVKAVNVAFMYAPVNHPAAMKHVALTTGHTQVQGGTGGIDNQYEAKV